MRIKEIIKEKGYTQKQVADMLGITPVGINQLINGKPSYPTLEKFAQVLNVPMWQLFASPSEVAKNVIVCPHCGKDIELSARESNPNGQK